MKKMKLPQFLTTATQPTSWQWPACGHLETVSFRATTTETTTATAVCIDTGNDTSVTSFANSDPGSSSTRSEEECGSDHIETVIRGLKSDRLFFDPGDSNSILDEATKANMRSESASGLVSVPYEESVFVSLNSKDPILDFRVSMEEMICAHGLNDWDHLEELLGWYLKVNVKESHGYIVDAFVDLLVSLSTTCCASVPRLTAEASTSSLSSAFTCTCSPSTPLSLPSSSLTTPCLSSLDEIDEDDFDENGEEISHLPS